MKKFKLLKLLALFVVLITSINTAWAGVINNYNYVNLYNTCTNSQYALSSVDGNKYAGTLYMPANTTYDIKLVIGKSGDGGWGPNWYWTGSSGGYTFTSSNTEYKTSFSQGGTTNDHIRTKTATSGYVKVYVEWWGDYDNQSLLKITQSDVSALTLSSLSSSGSSVAAGTGTVTLTPNGTSGGSGSYSYAYTSSAGGSFAGNTFTAPWKFNPTNTTITVHMTDANSQLSGLASPADKSTTVTINRPDNVYLKAKCYGWANWGWITASSNGDGTYSFREKYEPANGCDWSVYNNDETLKTYISSYTEVGSPKQGNDVSYKITPTAWSADGAKTATITVYKRFSVAATMGAVNGSASSPSVSGNTLANGKVDHGTSVTFTAPAAKTGYHWVGWYTNNTGTGVAHNTNASFSETITDDTEYYAIYAPNTYTINLDGQDATSQSTTSVTATYNSSTLSASISNPTKTGYTFAGWWSGEGGTGYEVISTSGTLNANKTGYTGAGGVWTKTSTTTLYAKWERYYTLRHSSALSEYPETAGHVTVTYKSSTLYGFTAAGRTGHTCQGYYTTTNAAGGGQKVITAGGALYNTNGASDTIVNTSNQWIYDGYLHSGWIYPRWTANTYTLTFDADDAERVGTATNVQATVSVTFNNNNYNVSSTPVTTVAVPVLDGYTFGGYYTVKNGGGKQIVDADGNWQSSKTSYTDASGNWIQANNVTLYAKWTAKTYTLTFDAGTNGGHMLGEAGDPATKDVTVTYGANYSVTGYVGWRSGYEFTGWFTAPTGGTQVTNDTRITTHSNHTIYAQYRERNYVYFYNNVGWTNVYVTYSAYWDDATNKGTGNWDKAYHQMEQIGTSNVYRDEIPASIIADWSGTNAWIAFDNTGFSATDGVGKYGNFTSGKVIHRRDFDSYATMFVPNPSAAKDFTKNGGADYYCTGLIADKESSTVKDYRYIDKGYWTRYNDKESGYVIKGSWDGSHDYYFTRFYTDHADTTSVVLHLNASTDYTFKLYKHCRTSNKNNSWFSKSATPFTITSAACTDIVLNSQNAGNYIGVNDHDITITTTAEGDYTFKLACDKSTGVLTLSVDYPRALEVRDHRLVYTWTPKGGSAHTWISPRKLIPNTARTPMSAFIHKPANVTTNSLKLQRWNGSAWVDAYTITLTDALITKNGVYYIEPNRVSGSIESVKVEPYTGKYYLRTDATGGGWKDYSNPSFGDYSMTYSAYSLTQTLSDPYSHFYCVYVDNTNTSVAFTIATEWTPSISDTLKTDALVTGSNCHLPEAANVRFMWNSETNELHRAYLKSAQGENARFLVLRGKADDMIFKSNGDAIPAVSPLAKNELQFEDKGDWIYEIELQAKPDSKACITAKFGGADRYLIGDGDVGGDNWETVLGGTGSTKYPMKGIYDFKTNRLMMMWTPPVGAITDNLKDVDMLWVRNGNNSASQINITTGSLTDVTVVGALEFKYNDLIGKVSSWNSYSRPLMKFMLSFPFDVNVSDIFGLNGAEYGREYIIQTYNGARRAEKGYYSLDGDFWEDLTIDSVMHANQGYSVIMDNVYLNNASSSIWEHKTSGSSIYLYFPAKSKIDIPKTSGTSTVAPHLSFDKPFGDGKNHINTDSHWNMIGSPLFHDSYVSSTSNDESKQLNAYYAWSSSDNTWGVEAESLRAPIDLDGAVGFPAMSSFIVQWYGTINWSTTATSYLRPAPKKEKGEVKNYLVRLDLIYNYDVTDKTYVQLSDDAIEGYSLCEDLNKIMNGNKSNIYLFADEYEVAYSQVPKQSDTIPVGLIIRRNGTYTFSMPTNFSGSITLIDTYVHTRTNLALEDYEVELTRGTINDRFLLEINPNNAPTAIDGVVDSEGQGTLKDGKAHKFIMNGQMYILENGKLYDATGRRVE